MRRSNRRTLVLTLILFRWLSSLSPAVALAADLGDDRPPRLDSPSSLEGVHSYRARGFDPGGPRPLTLWRFDDLGFLRLASTASDASGRFDFGEQTLPTHEVYFHVSIQNEEPDPTRLLRIERPVPAPLILPGGLGSSEIDLALTDRGGEIRIYDAESGRLLLRKPVGSGTHFSLSIDLRREIPGPWPVALSIEQVLEDGRRSDRQYWPLDFPTNDELDDTN